MRIIQHLWFEKDMMPALEFYTALIPGSKVTWNGAVEADNPSGPAGSVTIAEFTIGDQRYMAIEAGPLEEFNHRFSIMVECETQQEIDRIHAALADGGSIEDCGWVRDRFGLVWQVAPRQLNEWMRDPDKAKVRRVTEAQLQMKKFDIETLRQAFEGTW